MNGRTAKLLRRTAVAAPMVVKGQALSAQQTLNALKRTWKRTPGPQRHAVRELLAAAHSKREANGA